MIKFFLLIKHLIKNMLIILNVYKFKIILFAYVIKIQRKLSKENSQYVILNFQTFGEMLSSFKFAILQANKKKIAWNKIIFILPKTIINIEFINFLKKNFKVNIDETLYYNLIKSPLIFTKNINYYSPPNGWKDSQNAEIKFHISNEATQKVREFLRLNKIENNFVCITNRDNFFYKNKSNFTTYRNSKFKDYDKTINLLKKKYNYDVIRMGDYIDDENKNYISIMNSESKKLLDIYLPLLCKFSINTSSGVAWAPFLFNKPQLICNAIPLGELPSVQRGIILPKLIINSEDKKILKIKELLEIKILKINEFNLFTPNKNFFINYDATRFQSDFFYKEKKLIVLDNSEDDILKATQELIDYSIENKRLDLTQQQKQFKFKSAFPINHPMRKTNAVISPNWIDKFFENII